MTGSLHSADSGTARHPISALPSELGAQIGLPLKKSADLCRAHDLDDDEHVAGVSREGGVRQHFVAKPGRTAP